MGVVVDRSIANGWDALGLGLGSAVLAWGGIERKSYNTALIE